MWAGLFSPVDCVAHSSPLAAGFLLPAPAVPADHGIPCRLRCHWVAAIPKHRIASSTVFAGLTRGERRSSRVYNKMSAARTTRPRYLNSAMLGRRSCIRRLSPVPSSSVRRILLAPSSVAARKVHSLVFSVCCSPSVAGVPRYTRRGAGPVSQPIATAILAASHDVGGLPEIPRVAPEVVGWSQRPQLLGIVALSATDRTYHHALARVMHAYRKHTLLSPIKECPDCR